MRKWIAALMAAASLSAAPAPNPIRWELRDAPAKPAKPAARFTLKLMAHVEEGWHLYSMKKMNDGPIPTRIWIAEGQPFQLSAPVKSPEPLTLQDQNFNMEVEFYVGETTFLLPLRVTDAAASGPQKVTVSASYQACNDRICLPPRTVKVEVPVEVEK